MPEGDPLAAGVEVGDHSGWDYVLVWETMY